MADSTHRGLGSAADDYPPPENIETHILSLPPEITLSIFFILAEEHPPSLRRDSLIDRLGWIPVTHVCRAWRCISISTPGLWCRDLGRLPRALPEFIERAGDVLPVDLTAWVEGRRGNSIWFVDAGMSLSRIRSIDVYVAFRLRSLDKFTQMLAGNEAPILESLTFARDHPTHREYDMRKLLYAPRLRCASFRNIFLPFRAPSLISLSLYAVQLQPHTVLSDILDIISNSPLLEQLSINELYVPNDAYGSVGASKPQMHHLKRIALDPIYSGPSPHAWFLDRLVFPGSTVISISNALVSTPLVLAPILMSATRSIWRDDPPTGLAIRLSLYAVRLDFFSFGTNRLPDRFPSPTTAKLRASIELKSTSFLSDLRGAASVSDLSTIAILSLHGIGERSVPRADTPWVDIYSPLPGVRLLLALDMINAPDMSVLTALGEPFEHGSSSREPLLPHLEHVGVDARPNVLIFGNSEFSAETLLTALESRAQLRTSDSPALRSLWIGPNLNVIPDDPEGEEQVLRRLRVLVPNIYWKE
ncbi:hypothetical protein K488DRAFT_87735 [Vararia minispora EC-137]|uniref:Uncharacterized protein n=1 Tax=Vararia minispora EC-137 TaxID=1314806 RepID=A0ACB8QFN0_9AGAM|nr:hypothetical protein K488DRAFT_87735 [Vararia minispora EC-137]